jgi:hypothetical protein
MSQLRCAIYSALIPFIILPAAIGQPVSSGGDAKLQVVCSLEQPVVSSHGRVTASVVVSALKGSLYRWKATAGGFASDAASGSGLSKQGAGATVVWDADGATAGTYTLTATVTNASGSSGDCSLSVLVSEEAVNRDASSTSGLGAEAMRALLVKGRAERNGYGLYSYILFAARPDAANTERYREVLKSYLGLEGVNLETYFKLAQLNITYVPVIAEPLEDPPTLDSVMAQYDYSRARFLLSSLPPQAGDGPFLVSSIQPLKGPGTATGPYLVQNLSTVPVSVIPLWMKQFRSETTQQRVWEGKSIGTMALEMRTAIAIAAEGLPMTQKAVSGWIVLTTKP